MTYHGRFVDYFLGPHASEQQQQQPKSQKSFAQIRL
jgi:hypothetical protein